MVQVLNRIINVCNGMKKRLVLEGIQRHDVWSATRTFWSSVSIFGDCILGMICNIGYEPFLFITLVNAYDQFGYPSYDFIFW